MKRYAAACKAAVCLLVLPLMQGVMAYPAPGDDRYVFMQTQAVGFAEPIAFEQFIDDWNPQTYVGGKHALGLAGFELGFTNRPWTVSVSERYQAYADFSKDTAEFFLRVKNKQELDPNRSYRIDLEYHRAVFTSIRYTQQKNVIHTGAHKLAVLWGEEFHIGNELTSGRLYGSVRPASERDYDYGNLRLNYYYSVDDLLERPVKRPYGAGAGLVLQMNGAWAGVMRGELGLENVLGFIYWRQAPHTKAQINTDNKTYDENGYVRVKPALSGQNRLDDYTQNLPLIGRANVEFHMAGILHQVNDALYIRTYQSLYSGLGLQTRAGLLSLQRDLLSESVAFGVKGKYFNAGIAFDEPAVQVLRRFTVNMGCTIPLY